MAHSLRPLGFHLPNMLTLGNGDVVGNYTYGTLTAFFAEVGMKPRSLPPARRPIITLKRHRINNVAVPQILTTAAAEAVELGCWLHVQELDYQPQNPGPAAGQSEAAWMRDELIPSISAIDAWLKEIRANRRRIYLSYNNEFDMDATAGGGLKVWNGQPTTIPLGVEAVEAEFFNREGAFMEAVRDRLGCLPAFGNDASEVGGLRRLPARLSIFQKWGVTPAAYVYHGYGAGGHHAYHLHLLRETVRKAGFKGQIIGGELAKRVDTSVGNEADRNESGEWWRLYAFEAAKFPDVATCFFHLYEAAVPQILAAFKSPVPTGAATGVDKELVAQQAWGMVTALLPAEERATDPAGIAAGLRAARETR